MKIFFWSSMKLIFMRKSPPLRTCSFKTISKFNRVFKWTNHCCICLTLLKSNLSQTSLSNNTVFETNTITCCFFSDFWNNCDSCLWICNNSCITLRVILMQALISWNMLNECLFIWHTWSRQSLSVNIWIWLRIVYVGTIRFVRFFYRVLGNFDSFNAFVIY